MTPGHEVVAEVVAVGEGDASGFAVGDRAGAAWLRWTDNTCKFCRRGTENLCPTRCTPAGTPTAATPST